MDDRSGCSWLVAYALIKNERYAGAARGKWGRELDDPKPLKGWTQINKRKNRRRARCGYGAY